MSVKSLEQLEREAVAAQEQAAQEREARQAQDDLELAQMKNRVMARAVNLLGDEYGLQRSELARVLDVGWQRSPLDYRDDDELRWPDVVHATISLDDDHLPIEIRLERYYPTKRERDDGVQAGYKVGRISVSVPTEYGYPDTHRYNSLGDALVDARELRLAVLGEEAREKAREKAREERDREKADERQALLDQLNDDPVAIHLLKVFSAIRQERESWQEQVECLDHQLDNAYTVAENARASAQNAQAALDDRIRGMEYDKWALEDKVRDLESDLRRHTRGW